MGTSALPGYSGTPLAKKLGYKSLGHAVLIDAPADYLAMVQPLPEDVVFQGAVTQETDLVHLFATEREELAKQLSALRKKLKPEASVWVSWPKKSAKAQPTSPKTSSARWLCRSVSLISKFAPSVRPGPVSSSSCAKSCAENAA